MPVKDLFVYIDNDRNVAARTAYAMALAERDGAHLTGVYLRRHLDLPAYGGLQIPATVLAQVERDTEKMAQAAEHGFMAATAALCEARTWQVVRGRPGAALAVPGRFCDLLVLAQADPDDGQLNPYYRADDVLLGSGRPALILPRSGSFAPPTGQALIAWNGSREAARALHDALGLLARCAGLHLVTIGDDEAEVLGVDTLERHLSHHGLSVRTHHVPAPAGGVGEALLGLASDENCDLIVMGAYGHSRVRETVLGGATRRVLQHTTVPVLMAH